jgi:hypothetical protein
LFLALLPDEFLIFLPLYFNLFEKSVVHLSELITSAPDVDCSMYSHLFENSAIAVGLLVD